MGATLCTFPAFSLIPKNAMVDNLHGGPHLLTLRSCVSRCVSVPFMIVLKIVFVFVFCFLFFGFLFLFMFVLCLI